MKGFFFCYLPNQDHEIILHSRKERNISLNIS